MNNNNTIIENEVWKPIEGFPRYQVSNMGRVKSYCRDKVNGRIRVPVMTRRGYVRLTLCDNRGHSYHLSIHRAVATAFIPNSDTKPHINHKNGIKCDNRVANLEWCTASENTRHSLVTGLKVPLKGEQVGTSIHTAKEVDTIRKTYNSTNISRNELAKQYNVSVSNIDNIINNKVWKDNKYFRIRDNSVFTGESNPNAALDWNIVRSVRREYNETSITQKELACRYNVNQGTISSIIRNRLWYDKQYSKTRPTKGGRRK